jgi:hypothetical protein
LCGCFFCDVGFCTQFKEDLSGCHLADFMDFVYQAGYMSEGFRRIISNAKLELGDSISGLLADGSDRVSLPHAETILFPYQHKLYF